MTEPERISGARSCDRHPFYELQIGPEMNDGDLDILNGTFSCRRCWLLDPGSRITLLRMGGTTWFNVMRGIVRVALGSGVELQFLPAVEE